MSEIDFKKLSTLEQIDIINTELLADNTSSINKLCKKHGIARSTFNTRYMVIGYAYDDEQRQIIKKNLLVEEDVKEEITSNLFTNIDDYVSKDTALNAISDEALDRGIEVNEILQKFGTNEISAFKRILVKSEILDEMIDSYVKNKNVIEVAEITIDDEILNDTIVTKTIKVSNKAYDKWIAFCNENKNYKKQDLMSNAILEYIRKYK